MEDNDKKVIKHKRFPKFHSKYDLIVLALIASVAINIGVVIYDLRVQIMLFGLSLQLFSFAILVSYIFKAKNSSDRLISLFLTMLVLMVFITNGLLFLRS